MRDNTFYAEVMAGRECRAFFLPETKEWILMSMLDYEMPAILRRLHELEFDYADGDGIDFEPNAEFLTSEDTADWLRAWTGNQEVDGKEFRVFGQDGTGGYAAFWCKRDASGLLEQPIVFFGSEGAVGVVARNFFEYLWLLAAGIGPMEAVEYGALEKPVNEPFNSFATEHAAHCRASPEAVLRYAREEFPDFENRIHSLCR